MEMYGQSSSSHHYHEDHSCFQIDDLLDLTNADVIPDGDPRHRYPHPPLISDHHFNHVAPDLCVPSDDAAELEWLSRFVGGEDDTILPPGPDVVSGVKRPRAAEVRRCWHCLAEKTPQWRAGPAGPKTLCNACGVRFKSGRLVPEYRPAASPTFVLTQHSNSHRKVMELRRQKELRRAQQDELSSHSQHGFRVC